MLRILHDTKYDFIRWWKVMAAVTVAFIVLGFASLAYKAPNYSIEFTGGTLMQLEFAQPPDVGTIRSTLDDAGVHGAEIQQFGTNREFTVRAQNATDVAAQAKGALDQRHDGRGRHHGAPFRRRREEQLVLEEAERQWQRPE